MKIALTFSGGGFRASAFSLGSLSLLYKINCGTGRLLDHVEILSTVSGGTITGARYALSLKRKESFIDFYESLYDFMANTSLVELALDRLGEDSGWNEKRVRNLITAFADVYDRELFGGARFGELMDELPTTIKHISFNATEFTNALQFRFQWSEKILKPKDGAPNRGLIGNKKYAVPQEVARDIRLADIMAASSCFPGGFEPVNFPDDFAWSTVDPKVLGTERYPVGLMDGGIVDNQGIEPVLLAEARMKLNAKPEGDGEFPTITDLVIVCEVASPYLDGFQANQQHRDSKWKELSPKRALSIISVFWLLALFMGIWCFIEGHKIGLIISTVTFTLTSLILIISIFLNSMAASAGIPSEFLRPLSKLLKLRLYIYENLIANRFRSVKMLTMNVFLKHVRGMNYNKLYQDKAWMNRRIMNAIYELRTEDAAKLTSKVSNGKLTNDLLPSTAIQNNSDLASSMGTTLWFTKEELEQEKMLDGIIACGQYNMCWNLLEYIHKLKGDNSNTTESHLQLMACESQLMAYWRQFKHNPKFLLPTKGQTF